MYIVITGYEVIDNGITNGGRDFPVAIIRVGKWLKWIRIHSIVCIGMMGLNIILKF